ncbi:MAG: DUF3302 domain-containing protein [Fuerstiella sp.]
MEYQFESIGPALTVIVLVFLVAFAVVILGLIVALASLPGHIAKSRQHPQADAINICGWLGLPTGVLWVVALVWAYYRDSSATVSTSSGASKFDGIGQQLTDLESAVASLESSLKGTTR